MILADLKILLISALFFGPLYADEEITIEISDGKIKGKALTTINNTPFYSFQGIPYAQPPIDALRFQAPVPLEPWDDVVDATYEKNICYQVPNDSDDESEDCLFINVFTPTEPSSGAGLPVMFFIYGGGFVEGSSAEINYGPHHFMDYGVILVTFNYRVGPFGFFSTGDDAIPGNAGLKDQNLALHWVQKNIEYFGGDPTKVTIFGESAGSASVGYQILSPLSKGLFRAAIGESGSPLSAWAYQRNQIQITYQTAGYINPDIANASSSELLDYLLNLPAKDIDAASHTQASNENAQYQQIQQGFYYAPVIEHDHEGAFITERMLEILRKGDFNKVPLLIGFNSEESYFYHDSAENLAYLATEFDKNNSLLVPHDMHITQESTREFAARDINQFYVGDGTFAEDNLKLISYFSDQSFIRSIIKHATIQSSFSTVYFYKFSYSGVIAGYVQEPVEGFSDTVRHGEELSYIFRRNYVGLNTTDITKFPEQDQTVFKRFITFFTNFAKTLDPTPEEDTLLENIIWPKVNVTDFAYLDIGSYSEVKFHPREPNYHEWEAIYYKYGVPPYDTY
ncbi:venom carboxylesterase-6 [Anoplophora glabripennis]|uniref:venom carboxylesterase-6 n=1 Tax=Anoplophora glabripennis TaxID=217634 RepID=UPI0008753CD9|nr:venom carboxylesterase-6 [Anoplophora glabripennis]